jgi:Tfp pilus assembly protein FimT
MIPNYGYQLNQERRTRSRAELLANDLRLGRQAAAVSRGRRAAARMARASVSIALKAIAALKAGATTRAASDSSW